MQPDIKQLPKEPSHIAPDGSEIRELQTTELGGVAHCTLPVGGVTQAVKHKTVTEIWYFIKGQGEVWYRKAEQPVQETQPVKVAPGASLTIPTGVHFQFRNTGSEPLCFLIVTMPPWPGPDEAVLVENYWAVTE